MLQKNVGWHLAAGIFLMLFGAIYEYFSYGVYSYYMIYAGMIPIALGVLPYYLIGMYGRKIPRKTAVGAWNSGIAALAVGSVFKGVLEIYGTTNGMIWVYPAAGFILLAVGAGIYAFFSVRPERSAA